MCRHARHMIQLSFTSLLAEGKAHIALLQKDQKIDLRYGWFSL